MHDTPLAETIDIDCKDKASYVNSIQLSRYNSCNLFQLIGWLTPREVLYLSDTLAAWY